jgi:hypothetical protein
MAVPKLKYGIGNEASTTISAGISNTDTSASLTSDTNFNAKSGEGMVLLDEGEATQEFAYSESKTGSALSIPLDNRGLEGGSAQAHSAGSTIKGILTVGMWNDLIDSVLNILDQTTGAIKSSLTLTSPTINGATIATSKITPRVASTASSATPTPNADTTDIYILTALAEAAEFGAPTGTPVDGQKLIIRVTDDGTARALTYNEIYRAVGVALPTTTVISKTLYMGLIYNSAATKWDVVAVVEEA